jgi:hypothetical protein
MPLLTQIGDQLCIGALIQQEPHALERASAAHLSAAANASLRYCELK